MRGQTSAGAGHLQSEEERRARRSACAAGADAGNAGRFSAGHRSRRDGRHVRRQRPLKAGEQAQHLGQWVLAEDSGIAVDALAGGPGIYSARYAGPGATDQSNNERLLADLAGTPLERRTAHYVCQLALADPQGAVRPESGGKCFGRIRFEPAGAAGFGYDPLFEVRRSITAHSPNLARRSKAVLSHRARAVEQLLRRSRDSLPVATGAK